MGEQAHALLERLVGSLIGSAEMMNVYLGDRLGLYGPLADTWLTSTELASQAGIAERYAREWLEEQAVAGFIEVDDQTARLPTAGTHCRRSTRRYCWIVMHRRTWRRMRACWSRPRSSFPR